MLAPWYFRHGLVIRDNFVSQNGRVGVCWSGSEDGKTVGSGTQVYKNHVEVAAGTTCWSVDGKKKMTGHVRMGIEDTIKKDLRTMSR